MADAPTLSLIVAIAENGVIGRAGSLPWRLSSDLKRFRSLTMGCPLIMGKNTYISIGRPLDGRDNIVIASPESASSLLVPAASNLHWAKSLGEALTLARSHAEKCSAREIFVIGGAKLFAEALPLADRIYLTRVHGRPEGDTFWKPDLPGWAEVASTVRPASSKDEFAVTDITLERSHP